MANIDWVGSSNVGMTLVQSGTTVNVTFDWGLTAASLPNITGDWTIWATVNGQKSNTVPFTLEYGQAVLSQYSNPGSTVTVNIPTNLLGTTVTISFWAKRGSYEEDSSSTHAPSATFKTTAPSVSWSSGSSLSTVASGLNVNVTLSGSASVGGGFSGTVYYRLWCESTRKNSDGSTARSWSNVTPTAYDRQVTFYVEAYTTIGGSEFRTSTKKSSSITIDSGNYVSYYNGTSWTQCKAYYYNGSGWIECKPYYYNGSAWVEISSPV